MEIRCVAVYQARGGHREITVTAPYPDPPAGEFDSEVSFNEMTAKDWVMNNKSDQT